MHQWLAAEKAMPTGDESPSMPTHLYAVECRFMLTLEAMQNQTVKLSLTGCILPSLQLGMDEVHLKLAYVSKAACGILNSMIGAERMDVCLLQIHFLLWHIELVKQGGDL